MLFKYRRRQAWIVVICVPVEEKVKELWRCSINLGLAVISESALKEIECMHYLFL